MIRRSIAAVAFLVATPVLAQPMDHSKMPGMKMPAPAAPAKPKAATAKPKVVQAKPRPVQANPKAAASKTTTRPLPTPPAADLHAGHQMSTPPAAAAAPGADPHAGHTMPAVAQPAVADPHAGHQMPAGSPAIAATAPPAADPHAGHNMPSAATPAPELVIPDTPPPLVPTDHAAERFYSPQTMAASRAQLRREHGGGRFSQVMANIAEYQVRSGEDGFRWEGEAWYGGDINRFVLKTEGEGGLDEGVEDAEVQALFSRAVSPYFDVQVGLRQDFEPASRTYATVGFEGLAPYWFEVAGALFLSNKGDLSARLEGTYDLRLTQKWILQPRAELNLAAQDDRRSGVGSGLSNAELGLRLRYEIKKEFAPYVGISWDRKFGRSARFARDHGEGIESTSLVVGIRGWF